MDGFKYDAIQHEDLHITTSLNHPKRSQRTAKTMKTTMTSVNTEWCSSYGTVLTRK